MPALCCILFVLTRGAFAVAERRGAALFRRGRASQQTESRQQVLVDLVYLVTISA